MMKTSETIFSELEFVRESSDYTQLYHRQIRHFQRNKHAVRHIIYAELPK